MRVRERVRNARRTLTLTLLPEGEGTNGAALPGAALDLPQLGIQPIAQPVPEQIHGQYGEQHRQSRKE